MDCHFIHSRMPPIKKIETTDLGEDVEKLVWKSVASGNVQCLRHFGYKSDTFQHIKHRLTK